VRYKEPMLAKRSIRPTLPKGRYVTNRKGERTGVVLSLKRYARLMEDLHDLAIVAERKTEKPLSADELKRRLRQRGHL
jgi:PHD/YefM family antitoxin component YafN of YafNO toxin-antitoxin module